MPPRTMRVTTASDPYANTVAGMMRWTRDRRNNSQSPAIKESIVYSPVTVGGGSVPIGKRAPSGSQPSRPKKTNCAMIASQKTGRASPEMEMNRAKWSGSLSRRTEERIPNGTPTSVDMTKAMAPSSIVAGRNRFRSSLTGRLRRERRPKVASGEISHVGHVLRGQRVVQTVLLPDLFDGTLPGARSGHQPGWIAGNDVRQPEGDQREAEEHEDQKNQPANDQPDEHASHPLAMRAQLRAYL